MIWFFGLWFISFIILLSSQDYEQKGFENHIKAKKENFVHEW